MQESAYVRGAGAVAVDGRRVAAIVVAGVVLCLLALAGVTAWEAHSDNTRLTRLRDHGVGVEVVVTSCRGLASGTGITTAGYTCRGRFDLDGTHETVIRGTSKLRDPGSTLAGLTLPQDPTVLYSADGLPRPAASRYGVPAGAAVGAAAVAVAWLTTARLRRRRSRRSARTG